VREFTASRTLFLDSLHVHVSDGLDARVP
jgi:hypothetical protein